MQASGQLHAPASFPSRKEPVVFIGYEAGWASEIVWTPRRRENLFTLTGVEPTAIETVTSHYTDCRSKFENT
jgi:hypothetical protein